MAEYGPVPDDRTDAYRDAINYAFRLGEGPLGEDDDLEAHLYPELGDRRAVFDDDALHCVCRHYVFPTALRGDRHELAGLTVVASPPESRRDGHFSTLIDGSLREYRERGLALSALWPFDYTLYRHFGWAVVNRYAWYACSPDALAFADEDERRGGSFRPLTPEDWPAMASVLEGHLDRYGLTLSLERSAAWWRQRTFERHGEKRYVYGWERDGELRGYLVYGAAGGEGEAELTVHELLFVDHEALVNLLRFLAYHGSQAEAIRIRDRVDAPLLDVVPDPTALECTVHPGPMLRVVDVAPALEALVSPAAGRTGSGALEGRVVLEVDDRTAPWNDGRFALAVADGMVRCDRTDEAPDARLEAPALAQLCAGFRSAGDLERAGELTLEDDGARRRLDTWLPPTTPFLREYF